MTKPLPRLRRPGHRGSAILIALALLACGGGTSEPTTANPLPVLVTVDPPLILVGSGARTLTLHGNGFVPGSQARWNDADRVTRFHSAELLTVDLPARDLDTTSVSRLTVVNGAPGGGSSGTINVVVGYPVPQITSISPSTMVVSPPPLVPIMVTGTGFVPRSAVRFGANEFGISSFTPTQVTAVIPSFYFSTPGPRQVHVVNPGPGGGASNPIEFAVAYPVPTLDAAGPDSTFTGSAVTLTLTGTGFGPGSRVRWNDQDRPTTFVSTSRLAVAIPSSDVGSPTVAALSVSNPTPGGGTSNVLAYRVVEQAPVITSIDPGFVTAGSGAATIAIAGTNFRTGATVQWNGAPRSSTLLSSASMTIALTAADVATPQIGQITVTNPGASGTSSPMAVGVVASGATLAIQRTVPITHADLVYDPWRGVFYASIPDDAALYANSIVRIDPATGAVTGAVSAGNDPEALAITDGGQYLYVGLLGASTIVRVALDAFTKDIEIPLPPDFVGETHAEDIEPIPGLPQTIAASTFYLSSTAHAGIFLFDDATRRSATEVKNIGSNRITRGLDASRIFGYNAKSTEFAFRSLVVGATGLHEESVTTNLITGFNVDIEYGGGYVYATTGDVVNVSTMSKVGTIAANGIVRPDAANARVHFLNGPTIYTYHYTTFAGLGAFSDASLSGHKKLIRWGTNGLAVAGGSTVVLLSGGLVAP